MNKIRTIRVRYAFQPNKKDVPSSTKTATKVKGISGVKPPEKPDEKAAKEKHMIRKIGVISDTHIPEFKQLPPAIWQYFDGVERIIHAGDLSVLRVIAELEMIAPVVAVQGNIEEEEVVLALPIKREIAIGNCRIGIVHILGDAHNRARVAHQEFPTARVVVFGHSHIPWNEDANGQLLFNPGSATDRRRQPQCSIGMLHINDDAMSVYGEIIWL